MTNKPKYATFRMSEETFAELTKLAKKIDQTLSKTILKLVEKGLKSR